MCVTIIVTTEEASLWRRVVICMHHDKGLEGPLLPNNQTTGMCVCSQGAMNDPSQGLNLTLSYLAHVQLTPSLMSYAHVRLTFIVSQLQNSVKRETFITYKRESIEKCYNRKSFNIPILQVAIS